MELTQKQKHIMTTLIKANADGSFLDIDQLVENLPYKTTKQSMHFSIRALVKKRLISKYGMEKRRGRSRLVINPTTLGFSVMQGIHYSPNDS